MLFVRRDIFPQFLNSSMNEWETRGFVSTAKFVLPAWFQNNLPSDYQKFISLNSRSVYRQFSPKHYLSNVYISMALLFNFLKKTSGQLFTLGKYWISPGKCSVIILDKVTKAVRFDWISPNLFDRSDDVH